tara:strand:+ start:18494 stop:19486 length:993 start_codon:yes stop_codon:yes gene_type:complete
MSIYKRGTVWWVRFTTPLGQRIRRSACTRDKKAAQEFHDTLKAELWRVSRLGEKPRRTWQEAVLRWLDEKEHKADAIHDVEKLRWLDRYFGHMYLDDITADTIRIVATKKKSETTPTTANRYQALIRSILRAAHYDWEWTDRVPRVRMFKEPTKRVRWLTKEEARRLLDELPEHLADMAAFTLSCGLRRSNVTGLQWSTVDLERKLAWIHPDQSKSRKAIRVPLNQGAIKILKKWEGRHDTHVFCYQDKPIFQTSTKAWYAALERAEIENFRWHDLRHTWASWHVQSGTSLQELMELGGWSSYVMVLRYAHLATGQLQDAACRIDGILLD